MEARELRDALEGPVCNTPVWVEVDGRGYLTKSVSHEEVGIVIRIESEPWYRVTAASTAP